jgi:hypothetical protein
MEYSSAAAGGRTIAPGCRPPTGTGMCFFDDFVKYVMEKRFTDNYIPSSADHTITPNPSNLANIKKALPASARLLVQKVFPGVDFNVGPGGNATSSVTSTSSQPTSTTTSTTTSTSTTYSTITSQATLPAISSLPSCGVCTLSSSPPPCVTPWPSRHPTDLGYSKFA